MMNKETKIRTIDDNALKNLSGGGAFGGFLYVLGSIVTLGVLPAQDLKFGTKGSLAAYSFSSNNS